MKIHVKINMMTQFNCFWNKTSIKFIIILIIVLNIFFFHSNTIIKVILLYKYNKIQILNINEYIFKNI